MFFFPSKNDVMQVTQGYGCADPDSYQNVTDPEHWQHIQDPSLPSCYEESTV
jgi:hypothetical protein